MKKLLTICIMALATPASARPWAAFYCGKLQIAMIPGKYFDPRRKPCAPCDGKTHYFDMEKDPQSKHPLRDGLFRADGDGDLFYRGKKCQEFNEDDYGALDTPGMATREIPEPSPMPTTTSKLPLKPEWMPTTTSEYQGFIALPPAEFDHEPEQPVRVFKVTDRGFLTQTCGAGKIACAVLRPGECMIFLGPDVHDNARALRHERAHCNGWDPTHPGARVAPGDLPSMREQKAVGTKSP